MNDLLAINSRNTAARIGIGVFVVIALLIGWFAVRWQIGILLSDLTPATDPNAGEVGLVAKKLAPADPGPILLSAAAENDPQKAIALFEDAIRLAPNDFRTRIELGRAYEQDDQIERAEVEFKRAVELAPNYAAPRWHLGNFYLRQERESEALSQLTHAAEHNQTYRDQVLSLAWDYFQKDPTRVEKLVSEPAAIAHLAYFFAARGAAAASLRNWDRLSAADKERYGYRAISISDGLYSQRHFTEALSFAKQLGNATDAEPNKITNASFETNIGESEQARFAWQITRTEAKLEIGADGKVAKEGTRSLRMTFRGFAKPVLANVYQTVVVEPNTRYALSFWVRTSDLRSAGTPMLEVLNGVNDASLARTEPFANGTAEWQKMTLDLRTPENCSGIVIRTIRQYCGEECQITGSIWYDEFSLTKQ
ncbi:MAG: tetratricopeptide repeat protein [Pyrinomonadaceae bacterium]|nr:tetratricopeptide repeat protein [Pyrinomonadaceae bacterium]